MSKAKRRAETPPDPEIVRQAHIAAGILVEIFSTPESPITKAELLERPRPSGKLRQVRDVMIGALHHRFGVSQQKIAAALGRDRGVVSDAAHAIDEAGAGDVGVRFALAEITEQIANVLAHGDAWREALRQDALDEAIAAAKREREFEAEEDAELDAAELEEQIAAPAAATKTMRCHQCRSEGTVRIHGLGGDPAYRKLWEAAEAREHAPSGFHVLTCRFCDGAGERALKPAAISP